MTPHEQELLERFLADMTATRAGQKDPHAEALIREAAARQPDALYLLVQRALQLDQAFQLTQAEVEKLRGELELARAGGKAGGSGGFLSDPYAWGSQPAAAPSAGAQTSVSGQPLRPVAASQPQGVQPQASAAAGQQQPAAQARPAGWGGSGMLGTMAGTAAGVVGGAFLFQGIQNLMHRNDPAPQASHPLASEPQPLAADSHTQEPFLLNDPALSEDSAAADVDDTYAADDGSGDDFA
jgi:hypothetical protein